MVPGILEIAAVFLLLGASRAVPLVESCSASGQCVSDGASAVQTLLMPSTAKVDPVGVGLVECMGCVGCLWRGECRDTTSFEGANSQTCFKNEGKWCTESGPIADPLADPGSERNGPGGRVELEPEPAIPQPTYPQPQTLPVLVTRRRRSEVQTPCTPDAWSYEDAETWGVAGCEGCAAVGVQSPIDLDPSVLGDDSQAQLEDASAQLPYNFPSEGGHAIMFNDGTALRVNLADGNFGTLVLNATDGTYQVVELGFVFPSEHKVSNVATAGEMQIVLQKGTDKTVIVSILLQEADNASPDVQAFFSNFRFSVSGTSVEGTQMLLHQSLNLGLLERQLSGKYWSYMGSTSQPPCSPALRFVMARPASVSKEVLDDFRGVFEKNGRPVQPLGERLVLGPSSFTSSSAS